jgi:hypothetical protein
MKEIKQILLSSGGWIYATEDEPIEPFTVNGEMALVTWYRKGNREFNGKYVEIIEYNN